MISCGISIPKQRQRVLAARWRTWSGTGRSHRAAARHPTSSYLWRNVLRTCSLHRPRPDRHGRLREAADSGRDSVSLRRAPPTSTPCSRPGWQRVTWSIQTGVRPSASTGQPPPRGLKGYRVYGGDHGAAGLRHWDQVEAARHALQGLRSEKGEEMVLQNNFFIRRSCRGATCARSSAEEMAEYAPFAEPGEGRRPTLTWPRRSRSRRARRRDAIVTAYADWLATSNGPSCSWGRARGNPRHGPVLDLARSFPAQTEGNDRGGPFRQEDSPDEIGGPSPSGWGPCRADRSRCADEVIRMRFLFAAIPRVG